MGTKWEGVIHKIDFLITTNHGYPYVKGTSKSFSYFFYKDKLPPNWENN